MALNIKNAVAEELAREVAATTGESLTEAVIAALRDRLAALRRRELRPDLMEKIAALQAFVRAQPVRDGRTPEEILGYDERGLPG